VLKWLSESGATRASEKPEGSGRIRERIGWLAAGLLAVALLTVVIPWRGSKPQEQAMYFPAPLSSSARDIAVAPNGHTVAVVAYLESARKNALWIYELGAPTARSLPGTAGATYPFWSADGQSLGFFADAN